MAQLQKQCISIMTFFRFRKTASEMHEMLKRAFRENATGRTQTVVFHDSNVGNSVEDGDHSYHSQDSCTVKNVEKVCKVINKDWQDSILEVTDRSQLSYGTCQ